MKRICMICKKVMQEEDNKEHIGKTTHGMCRECVKKMVKKHEEMQKNENKTV